MPPINAILTLINAALPGVASLIVAIKDSRGQVNVGVLLNSADTTFDATITAAQQWLAQHPQNPPPATPSAKA